MENQQEMGIPFEKFTWKIEGFSKLNTKKLSSKAFKIGGYRWQIIVYPKGKDGNHLSLYMKVADSLPPYGWSRFVYFRLALINQLDSKKSIVKDICLETQQKFNAGYSGWGSPSFIPLTDFRDRSQGYLVNDTCVIEAHVSVSKVAFNILDNLAKGITNATKTNVADGGQLEPTQKEDQGIAHSEVTLSPTYQESNDDHHTESEPLQLKDKGADPSDVTLSPKHLYFVPSAPPWYPSLLEEPEEVLLSPNSELIDFNKLGQEEAAFIPLLEEVCSRHPSLIENQRKRSPRFIQWAFTALGRVLHFLETKKVRDMSEDACQHLHVLWEELESFGFDLTWLEPYVHSALAAKGYLEGAEQVKNLRGNAADLEMEVRKLRTKLAVLEVDIEIARRDLAEAKEGFDEKDMDAKLL